MTEFRGLTSQEVEESKKKFGQNIIPDTEPTTFWDEFKETFGDPMIKILLAIVVIMLGAAALKIFGSGSEFNLQTATIGSILKEFIEPIGTLVAVFLVATISAKTAVSSDKAFRNLKSRTEKEKCKVLRDFTIKEVYFEDLVVGDIVELQSGDKIPADGVLIKGQLKVDNSALNGESEEAKKFADENAVLPNNITGDTFVDKSSLFRGAIVTDGEGFVRIDKIALNTMMGKMAEEMNEDEVDSPLKVKLGKLANQISIFGYVAAAAILVITPIVDIFITKGELSRTVGTIIHNGWDAQLAGTLVTQVLNIISLAILIVVCAVPEGLPLMISLVLMQNTSKMLDHNVLVRKAIGIETAGSLNILFSDKTGTITKGQLEVVNFINGSGNDSTDKFDAIKEKLLYTVKHSTQASFDENGNVFGGNMTDKALLKYVGQQYINSDPCDEITAKQDFNSANKFSQVEIAGNLYYKGAPEKIVAKCNKYLMSDGSIEDLDIEVINKVSLQMASEAKRLLAFAYKENTHLQENAIQDDLILIGLVAIRDDVRPEAKDAIEIVKNAGIQVVMITGDRLETAKAIATDAKLINDKSVILTEENKAEMLAKYKSTTTSTDNEGLVVSSDMLNKLTDEEVKILVSGIKVIARALPTDKSRMVRICQEMNLVCGMTGDGVNDSPALKKADVGFAMGSGTEAAKEAGDLIIIDDNFKSIKDAIWYGRTIYHNILKFVKFQLMINIFAVIMTLFASIVGVHAPLTVCGLLIVNLLADSLSSLKFGPEPAEIEYLNEKPRKRDESILNKATFIRIIAPAVWLSIIGFILLKLNLLGQSLTQFQTQAAFFVFFMFGSIVNSYNCRTDDIHSFKNISQNKSFLKIDILIMVIISILIYASCIPMLEPVSNAFGFDKIPLTSYLIALSAGITVYPIGLLLKIKK